VERKHLRGVVEDFFETIEIDGFGKDSHRAGFAKVVTWGPGGNQNNAGGRVLRNDVAAGGRAIQFRHPIIHQNDVWLVTIVSLDGFESGANDFNDFVLAMRNQRRQSCSNTSLVVSD